MTLRMAETGQRPGHWPKRSLEFPQMPNSCLGFVLFFFETRRPDHCGSKLDNWGTRGAAGMGPDYDAA